MAAAWAVSGACAWTVRVSCGIPRHHAGGYVRVLGPSRGRRERRVGRELSWLRRDAKVGEEGPVEDDDEWSGRGLDRQIANLALPALGALALDPLLGLVDTGWVGRLESGPSDLAGLGTGLAVFAFTYRIFNFLTAVTGPLVAQEVAQGDAEAARKTVGGAVGLALALGFVSAGLLIGFRDPIVALVAGGGGGDQAAVEGVEAAARDYLAVRACALPAVLVSNVGVGAYRGLLDTRTPLRIAAVANLLNFTLDPILIFGAPFFHVPAFGVAGAAGATAISECVAAAAYVALLVSVRPKMIKRPSSGAANDDDDKEEEEPLLRIVDLTKIPGPGTLAPLLAGGASQIARTLSLQVFLVSAVSAAVRMDVSGLSAAAYQISLQVYNTLLYALDALAVPAQGLVASALGTGDVQKARRAGDRLLYLGTGAGFGLALLVAAGHNLLPSLLTDDPDVADLAAPLLLYAAFLQPLNGVVFVGDGIFQGATDFRYLAYAMGLAVALSLTFLEQGIVPLNDSLAGIWAVVALLQILRAAGLAARYYDIVPNSPLGLPSARK